MRADAGTSISGEGPHESARAGFRRARSASGWWILAEGAARTEGSRGSGEAGSSCTHQTGPVLIPACNLPAAAEGRPTLAQPRRAAAGTQTARGAARCPPSFANRASSAACTAAFFSTSTVTAPDSITPTVVMRRSGAVRQDPPLGCLFWFQLGPKFSNADSNMTMVPHGPSHCFQDAAAPMAAPSVPVGPPNGVLQRVAAYKGAAARLRAGEFVQIINTHGQQARFYIFSALFGRLKAKETAGCRYMVLWH